MMIDVFEVIQGFMDKVLSTVSDEAKKEQFKKEYAAKMEELKKKPRDTEQDRMLLYSEISRMVEGWGVPMEKLHALVQQGSFADAQSIIQRLLMEEDERVKAIELEKLLKEQQANAYREKWEDLKRLSKNREAIAEKIAESRNDSLNKNIELIKSEGVLKSLANEKEAYQNQVKFIKDELAKSTEDKHKQIEQLKHQLKNTSKTPTEAAQINQQILFAEAERDKQLNEMQAALLKSGEKLSEIEDKLGNQDVKVSEQKSQSEASDEELNKWYREETENLRQQREVAESLRATTTIKELDIRTLETEQSKAMAELTKNSTRLDSIRSEISKITKEVQENKEQIENLQKAGGTEFDIKLRLDWSRTLEKQLAEQQKLEKELMEKNQSLTKSIAEKQEKISELRASPVPEDDKELKSATEMTREFISDFSKEEFNDRFSTLDPNASLDQRIASLMADLSREIQKQIDEDLKHLKDDSEKELYLKSLEKAVNETGENLPEQKDKKDKSKKPKLVVPGSDSDPKPSIAIPVKPNSKDEEIDSEKQQKMSSGDEKPKKQFEADFDLGSKEDDAFKRWLDGLFKLTVLLLRAVAPGVRNIAGIAAAATGAVGIGLTVIPGAVGKGMTVIGGKLGADPDGKLMKAGNAMVKALKTSANFTKEGAMMAGNLKRLGKDSFGLAIGRWVEVPPEKKEDTTPTSKEDQKQKDPTLDPKKDTKSSKLDETTSLTAPTAKSDPTPVKSLPVRNPDGSITTVPPSPRQQNGEFYPVTLDPKLMTRLTRSQSELASYKQNPYADQAASEKRKSTFMFDNDRKNDEDRLKALAKSAKEAKLKTRNETDPENTDTTHSKKPKKK